MSFQKRIENYKKSQINFQEYDSQCYVSIHEELANTEMMPSERFFLNGVIRYFKPKKLLELGVSAGSSSTVILNAIRDMPETRLYSVDVSATCYMEEEKPTGYIVSERFAHLTDKWILKTGAMVHEFIDEIGDDIDFCFIDTAHCLPGEVLDFLMVLPYLAKNAAVVLHDTSLQTIPGAALPDPTSEMSIIMDYTGISLRYATSVLQGLIKGIRLHPVRTELLSFPNIGGLILADDVREDMWPYFNSLLLPWENWYYNESNWEPVQDFLARHYSAEDMDFFKQIMKYKDLQQYQIDPTDFKIS